MSAPWRSLDELVDSPEFRDRFAAEFPSLTTAADWKRRDILKCMGAAVALAGLDGCERQPDERALPYVEQPEGEVLGKARFYATALDFDGIAQPVVGKTRAGRPIKLDGNPDHPASGGKSDPFTQAALLGLYDPERSRTVLQQGRISDWERCDRTAAHMARRLDATGGAGFRLLTGPLSSPTLLRLIAAMRERWPNAGWHEWSPVPTDDRRLPIEQAAVIVSFDDDWLGPGPLQVSNARGWAARRIAFQHGQGDALLMVAEPTPTLTGITADERLIAADGRLPVLLSALATGSLAGLGPRERTWIGQAAAALDRSRGRGLVTVGPHQPGSLHMLAERVNQRFGNPPLARAAAPAVHPAPIEALLQDMRAGKVGTLAVLGCNPAYADLRLAALMHRVPMSIHAGLHVNETAARSTWHMPLAHELESWGDGRAADGSTCLVQPLVRPWLGVRSPAAMLSTLLGQPASDHELVRQTWSAAWGASGPALEQQWQAALLKGIAAPAPAAASSTAPTPSALETEAPSPMAVPGEGLTLLIRPDPTIWDGRFADNPWLQELPKPITKMVWGNAVHISPALARQMSLENGDEVELAVAGRSVRGPCWILPGQERNTLLVHSGYGRSHGGAVSRALGFSVAALGPPGSRLGGATLRKTGGRQPVVTTQHHFAIPSDGVVRSVPAAGARLPPPAPQANTYPPLPKSKPSWGMAIDLDLCIGCNACVTACVAENNIAMVGKEQVAKGREMHWLRVDRYYEGSADDPRHAFQPVPCMHCEDAPCEMGCPVNATVHSPDGLNLQVYNRCIGTRTCSAYCPYKVRRFNWFDFTGKDSPELQAARNPEVTVRGRGVMEKCTYCIQRLQNARIDAEVAGDFDWAAAVQTACQQACPTQAIIFGDLSDPDSPVSRRKRNGRDYSLLEEANTRPRTTYSAQIAGGEQES